MIPRSDLYRLVRKTFQASNENPAAVFTRWVRDGVVLQPDLDLQDLITAARVLAGEAWEDQEPPVGQPRAGSLAPCAGSGALVIDPSTGDFTGAVKVVQVEGGGRNGPSFSGGTARCSCGGLVPFDSSGCLEAHVAWAQPG